MYVVHMKRIHYSKDAVKCTIRTKWISKVVWNGDCSIQYLTVVTWIHVLQLTTIPHITKKFHF